MKRQKEYIKSMKWQEEIHDHLKKFSNMQKEEKIAEEIKNLKKSLKPVVKEQKKIDEKSSKSLNYCSIRYKLVIDMLVDIYRKAEQVENGTMKFPKFKAFLQGEYKWLRESNQREVEILVILKDLESMKRQTDAPSTKKVLNFCIEEIDEIAEKIKNSNL